MKSTHLRRYGQPLQNEHHSLMVVFLSPANDTLAFSNPQRLYCVYRAFDHTRTVPPWREPGNTSTMNIRVRHRPCRTVTRTAASSSDTSNTRVGETRLVVRERLLVSCVTLPRDASKLRDRVISWWRNEAHFRLWWCWNTQFVNRLTHARI